LDESGVETTRIAGLLHDVGKAEVSVELLRKTAALSQGEEEQLRAHTTRGAALVKPVGGILAAIADTVEAHHEKYDGTGYRGMGGEDIPLLARIVAVADAFDALLSDRPYRKGVGVPEALASIAASAGADFDPKVVAGLQRIVSRDGGEDALAQMSQLQSVHQVE
jgi:HD-GYP domain-containing protein (c-di-GMP phosphodiesterase class II)